MLLSIFVAAIAVPSLASEPVKIFVGGPRSYKLFSEMSKDIEGAAKAKVEVVENSVGPSVKAIKEGKVDLITIGTDPQSTFAQFPVGEANKDDIKNYEMRVLYKSRQRIALHPKNPVQALTDSEVSDILTGKIKNWSQISGGKDRPVSVFLAQNYRGILKTVLDTYKVAEKDLKAEMTIDKKGLLRKLQMDEGGLFFNSTKEESKEFKPKYIDSKAEHPSYIVIRKNSSPSARRAFDYIISKPLNGEG